MPEGACLQSPGCLEQGVHGLRTVDKPLPVLPGQIALEEVSPGGHVVPLPTSPPADRPYIYRLTEDEDEPFFYDEESSDLLVDRFRPALSDIYEQTEPSDDASMRKRSFDVRQSRQSLARMSSQASTADYGQILGKPVPFS